MIIQKCALLFAGCALLAGCTTNAEKRWKHVIPAVDGASRAKKASGVNSTAVAIGLPEMTISTYQTPTEDKAPTADGKAPSLKDLSDHGQAAYLDGLSSLVARTDLCQAAPADPSKPGEKLPKSENTTTVPKMVCPYQTYMTAAGVSTTKAGPKKGSVSMGYATNNEFKRTIVVNVLNSPTWPQGDRLHDYTVSLELKTYARFVDQPKFTKFTIAQTQSTNYKYGTIAQTTEFTTSNKLAPTIDDFNMKGAAELNVGAKNSKLVSSDISEAMVPLNVNIQDSKILIQRRGNQLNDISGNTLVALTIVTPVDRRMSALVVTGATLYDEGKAMGPDQVSFTADYTAYPPKGDVLGQVKLNYGLRHIEKGQSTFTEGDDDVQLVAGELLPKEIVLVSADEIAGDKWIILALHANSDNTTCKPLSARAPGFAANTFLPLYFANDVAAITFAEWLRLTKATALGADQFLLKANNTPLDPKLPGATFTPVKLSVWTTQMKETCPTG